MRCRVCGTPVNGDAVFLTATNRPAKKPACQHCYEMEIRGRRGGRMRVRIYKIQGPAVECNGPLDRLLLGLPLPEGAIR